MNIFVQIVLGIFMIPIVALLGVNILAFLLIYFFYRIVRVPVNTIMEFVRFEGKELTWLAQGVVYGFGFPAALILHLFSIFFSLCLYIIYFFISVCSQVLSLNGNDFYPFIKTEKPRNEIKQFVNGNFNGICNIIAFIFFITLAVVLGLTAFKNNENKELYCILISVVPYDLALFEKKNLDVNGTKKKSFIIIFLIVFVVIIGGLVAGVLISNHVNKYATPEDAELEITEYYKFYLKDDKIYDLEYIGANRPRELDLTSVFSMEVVSLSTQAFSYLDGLETLYLPDSLRYIKVGSFSNLVNLKEISIPESVELIESNAFINCPLLDTVHISANVKVIKKNAFSGISAEPVIYLYNGTVYGEKWDDDAFPANSEFYSR